MNRLRCWWHVRVYGHTFWWVNGQRWCSCAPLAEGWNHIVIPFGDLVTVDRLRGRLRNPLLDDD